MFILTVDLHIKPIDTPWSEV